MVRHRRPSQVRSSADTKSKASRKHRLAEAQVVKPIIFADKAVVKARRFQDCVVSLFGPAKIGKSKFASCIPNIYFLATEPGYEWLKLRTSDIDNWPTFKRFVEEMEKSPRKVKTVSMWTIDTIDRLCNMCMATICYEWGLTDLSEEGWSRAWTELRDEVTYWILRLKALGPGILFISHERQRDIVSRRIKLTKDSLDLPNTTYNVISYFSDITLHMRYVGKSRRSEELGKMRCLATVPSEAEDAGDRTGRLPEIIKFRTEKQAVRKILRCFESDE